MPAKATYSGTNMKHKIISGVTLSLLLGAGAAQAQSLWYKPWSWFQPQPPKIQDLPRPPASMPPTNIAEQPEPQGGFSNLGGWTLGVTAAIGAGAALGSSGGGSDSTSGTTGSTGTN